MSDHPVISVENLSKRYVIGHETRHDTLRDRLSHGVGRLFRGRKSPGEEEEFWALRDVSFDIRQGEVVGVIGRNGAGKSTLLKILSRITEPTSGRVGLRGRVASLLEVGTGFHPELTGRENIFLNGAILGMSRVEIRKKFDEIVAFAEVERFLDTPVKRYSSGMYVRLAFAVAAHLEPEILIVDEVLAVGDAQFQKKCLGKMQDVARNQGRTVLFVSHNLSVIQAICKRCVVLQQGRVVADESTSLAVREYLQPDGGEQWKGTVDPTKRHQIRRAEARLGEGSDGRQTLGLELEVHCAQPTRAALEVILQDSTGQNVAIGLLGTVDSLSLSTGTNQLAVNIPVHHLALGRYGLSLRLTVPGVECLDEALNALFFDFQAAPAAGQSYRIAQNWGFGSFILELEQSAGSNRGRT